ncbi:MAG: acyltransferase [Polynucleobacter sp.]|nr:MAG: acyltransferase [Polynucleobacter sp.]
MNALLSKLISRIKGGDWHLDSNLSQAEQVHLVLKKGMMYFRGIMSFQRINPVILLGKNTTIIAKNKIVVKGVLSIERNSHIDATSLNGIVFGNNVSLGKYTHIECSGSLTNLGVGLTVGDNVGLGANCFYGCAGGITIGDDTIFGNFISLHSENHNYERKDIPIRLQGVNRQGITIGKDCWIGAKATILDGVEIGNGCIVAAGAVVTKGKYPDYSILGGIPAKIISTRA